MNHQKALAVLKIKVARRSNNPFSLCIEGQSAQISRIAAWMPSKTNNCKYLGQVDATKIRKQKIDQI
jgi:hypothetical protein